VPGKFRQLNFVRPHSHGSILNVALTPIARILRSGDRRVLHSPPRLFEVALFVIGGSAIGAAIAFLMGA
jgi:hypothetical protein